MPAYSDQQVVLGLGTGAFFKEARRTIKSADGIAAGFNRAGSSLSSIKTLLATGIGFATLTGFLKSAISEAILFDKAMREVNTLINESFGSIDELGEAVKILATEFGQSPTATAQALYQIISAGAADAAAAILTLDAAQKLAVGGVTNVALAADGLTSVLTSYNLTAEDLTTITDTMFLAMREGKTTIGELSGSVGDFAPVAAAANISMQEMFAATAALTTGGLSTAQAFTGLRQMTLNILKPTKQAVELAAQLAENYEGFEFSAKRLGEIGFAKFMDDVKNTTGGATDKMVLLFGSIQGSVAAFGLMGPAGEKMNQILRDMENESGATELAFRKMQGPMFEIQSLMQNFNVTKIAIGNKVMGKMHNILIELNNNFKEVTRSLGEFILNLIKLKLVIIGVSKLTVVVILLKKTLKSMIRLGVSTWALNFIGKLSGMSKGLFGVKKASGLLINSLRLLGGLLKVGFFLYIIKEIADFIYSIGIGREALDFLAQTVDKTMVYIVKGFQIGLNRAKAAFNVGFTAINAFVTKIMGSILYAIFDMTQSVLLKVHEFVAAIKIAYQKAKGFITGSDVKTAVAEINEELEISKGRVMESTEAYKDFYNPLKNVEEIQKKSDATLEELNKEYVMLKVNMDKEIKAAEESTYANNNVKNAYEDLIDKVSGLITKREKHNEVQLSGVELTSKEAKAFKELIDKLDPLQASQEKLTAMGDLLAKGIASRTQATIEDTKQTQVYKDLLEQVTATYLATQDPMRTYRDRLMDIRASVSDVAEEELRHDRAMQEATRTLNILKASEEERVEILGILKNKHTENINALYEQKKKTEEAAEATDSFAKIMEDGLSRALDRVNDAFVELWKSAFTGFGDFAKQLKAAFLQLLATLAHEALTKPIVMNITASFTGGVASGIGASAGSFLSGLGQGGSSNLLQSLGIAKLFGGAKNLLTEGIGGLLGGSTAGTAAHLSTSLTAVGAQTGGVTQAFAAGGTGGTGTASLFEGFKSSAIASALAGFAGTKIANLLGLGGGTGGSIGGTAGSVIGSAVGGPIGAAIGGFIGSALGGLFSSKPSNKGQYRNLRLSTSEITSQGGTGGKFSQQVSDTADTIIGEIATAREALEAATGAKVLGGAGGISFEIGKRDKSIIRFDGQEFETPKGDAEAVFSKVVELMVGALEGGNEKLVSVLRAEFARTGDINTAVQAAVQVQTEIVALEVALASLDSLLGSNPITGALEEAAAEASGMAYHMDNIQTNMGALAQSFIDGDISLDGFLVAVEDAQGVMQAYAAAIEQARLQGFGQIDDLLKGIAESKLSEEELYDVRLKEAQGFLGQIKNTVDPQQLADLISNIVSTVQNAFGIASGLDNNSDRVSELESLLKVSRELFDTQLNQSKVLLDDANLALREDLKAVQEEVAARHEKAATIQVEAADRQYEAAQMGFDASENMSQSVESMANSASSIEGSVDVFGNHVNNINSNINIGVTVHVPQGTLDEFSGSIGI